METMREFQDAEGRQWVASATPTQVAHRKEGRLLVFRPAGATAEDGNTVYTNVTFNGQTAAENAIRTMSEKELRRRLELAADAGGARRDPLL